MDSDAMAPDVAPERVPVVQIRISQDHERCAVLGEFHAADKVLERWVDARRAVNEFEFELVFQDGYRYRGAYAYRMRRNGPRPSLGRFVRALFAAWRRQWEEGGMGDEGRGASAVDPGRYAVEGS